MIKNGQVIGQFDTPEALRQPKGERPAVEDFVVSHLGPEGEINLSELRLQVASHFPEMSNRDMVEELYSPKPVLPLAQEKETEKEEKKTVSELEKEYLDRIRQPQAAVPLRQEVPIAPHTNVVLTQDTLQMDRGEITRAVSKSRGLAQNTFGIRDFIDYLKSLVEKPDSNFGDETRGKRLKDKLGKRFMDIKTRDNMQYELGVTGQGTRSFG